MSRKNPKSLEDRLEYLIDTYANGDMVEFCKDLTLRNGIALRSPTLSAIISGSTVPTGAFLASVAKKYQVPAEWLTLGVGDRPVKVADEKTLAAAIEKISDGVTRLLGSGLNRRAIVVLLHDHTKVPRGQIEEVLDGLETLANRFTK